MPYHAIDRTFSFLVANDHERRLADGHFGTAALRARR